MNRFSLATAVAAAGLYAIVVALLSDAPSASAGGDVVLHWATVRRDAILACTPVWTLSVAAIYAFTISVADDLLASCASRNERALVALGGVASLLTFGISLVGFLFLTTLAWLAPAVSPEIAKALSALSLLSVNTTGVPTALTVLPWSFVLWRRGLASTPMLVFGGLVATVHLVSTCAFASSGPLSPSGVGGYVAPPMYYAWTIWLGRTGITSG